MILESPFPVQFWCNWGIQGGNNGNNGHFLHYILDCVDTILPDVRRGHFKNRLISAFERSWNTPKRLSFKGKSFNTDRLLKLSSIMDCSSDRDFYSKLISHWKGGDSIVVDDNPMVIETSDFQNGGNLNFLEWMMVQDTVQYLPDDILAKVDRASMAVSLEARVPFLDYRNFEFLWSLPIGYKVIGKQGKRLTRQIISRYLPEELVNRPKKGFGIPLAQWLRIELKDWAHQLLDPKKIRSQGFLDSDLVEQKWQEHLSGKRNWHYYLWDVLMFQAWINQYY